MGIFDRVKGRLVEDSGTSQRDPELDRQIELMWDWLRTNFDSACNVYQKQGDPSPLRSCLTGRALDDTITMLNSLRSQNLLWSFPQRRERSNQRLSVDHVSRNTYIISEYFRDYSVIERYQNNQLVEVYEGLGEERAIRATILLDQSSAYYISDIVLLSDSVA